MKSVVNLKRGGAGWVVRVIRHDFSYGRELVERLGFVWRSDLGTIGAYTTGNAATALALLDSNELHVVGDSGVEVEVRTAAASISVTGDATANGGTRDIIAVTAGVTKKLHAEAVPPALEPADAVEIISVMNAVTKIDPGVRLLTNPSFFCVGFCLFVGSFFSDVFD